jgi:hypothetical protein
VRWSQARFSQLKGSQVRWSQARFSQLKGSQIRCSQALCIQIKWRQPDRLIGPGKIEPGYDRIGIGGFRLTVTRLKGLG